MSCLLLRLCGCSLAWLYAGGLPLVHAQDWPHWRGPQRNGTIAESSGWNGADWPLREIWVRAVGEGSTSPLIVNQRLFTMGWRDGQDHVLCLNAETGETIWSVAYKCPRYGRLAIGDQGIYSGPSSTPEFDGDSGFLYTLSTDGDLQCWDAQHGAAIVWKLNLYDRFDVPQRPQVGRSGRRDYGYTSSPLVWGEWLIVEVGAKQGSVVAFDKRTGEQRWASRATSPAGHNGGPVPITVEGVPCVAVHNHDGLLVVRMDSGKEGETAATCAWETSFANNIATPTVDGKYILLTSAYNQQKIAKYEVTLAGAKQLWEQKYASKVSSPVIHKGHVYWAWQNVMCLDFETGELRWRGGKIGDPGSVIATADDRLIVWGNRGNLILAETAERSPRSYRELAVRKGLGDSDAWPHIVLAGGALYCKDRNGNLRCLAQGP